MVLGVGVGVGVQVLHKALSTLSRIGLVERRVMNRLFWKQSPSLKSVQSDEAWVQNVEKSILEHFAKCFEPVGALVLPCFSFPH